MIYIIFGASGSGKTTLLNIIKSNYDNVDVHTKAVTRNVRLYDDDEIVSMPLGIPTDKYDYIYSQYGYEYGIEKAQIEKSLIQNRPHFIICNDIETVEKLKNDFLGQVSVIFLCFDAPKEVLEQIQKTRKISDDEIEVRLNKIQYLNQVFIEKNHVFDEVIKNNYGDAPDKMLKQIDRIINGLQSKSNNIQEMLETIRKEVVVNKKEELSVEKDFLFIIMAMSEEEPILEDIHSTFKRICEFYKLRAERVDDKFSFQQIYSKILNHIKLAEFIIADLTFERPNCYYEIGYAHALDKKVILTARRGSKIHFDISNFPVIWYNSMSELERKLKEMFEKILPNR